MLFVLVRSGRVLDEGYANWSVYMPRYANANQIFMVKRKRLRKISGLIFSKRSKWTFRLKGNISNGRIN